MNSSDKKLNAKEALIQVARDLFIEKGYEAVSTRELAEAAGVNLGAIQYHFGSKAKLFVETVRTMMQGGDCVRGQEILSGELLSREDAVRKLCGFIRIFLDNLLRPQGPQPCKIMLREIFTPTSNDPEMFEALTSAVVNDFIKPNDVLLSAVIRKIEPGLTSDQVHFSIASIIGQCFFYLTHAPFLLRLRGVDYAISGEFDKAASHVATFSLRGIGCDEETVAMGAEFAGQSMPHERAAVERKILE